MRGYRTLGVGLCGLVLFCTFIFRTETQAQTIYAKGMFNFSQMDDLKALQRELCNELVASGIRAKVTEDYPAYSGFQLGIDFPVGSTGGIDILVGGFVDYASTGGRVHYQDYSGEVKNDQIADAISLGVNVSTQRKLWDVVTLDLGLSTRLMWSTFKNLSTFRVADEQESSTLTFDSFGFGVEPGALLWVSVLGMKVGTSASYLAYLPSVLAYGSNSGLHLVNDRGDEVLIDWSGFKLGLVVGYEF